MTDDELIPPADRAELVDRVAMTLRRSRVLRALDQPFPAEAARRLAGEVVASMIARQFWVRRRVQPALVAPAQYTVAIPAFEGSYDYQVATRLFWRPGRADLMAAAGATELGDAARRHNWPPAYNVPALGMVPVVRFDHRGRRRQLDLVRWGITPNWLQADVNPERRIALRGDYLLDDAPWRQTLRHRRCLIVVEGYIEWRTVSHQYQPHAVARVDGQPMLIAGLWGAWRGDQDAEGDWLRSCALVTTSSNQTVQPLAHRMPLIIEQRDAPIWLGESPVDDHRVKLLMTNTIGSNVVRIWPVSTAINSAEADGPECLEPIAL